MIMRLINFADDTNSLTMEAVGFGKCAGLKGLELLVGRRPAPRKAEASLSAANDTWDPAAEVDNLGPHEDNNRPVRTNLGKFHIKWTPCPTPPCPPECTSRARGRAPRGANCPTCSASRSNTSRAPARSRTRTRARSSSTRRAA
ncbi:hypothetical protein PUN4_50032 [Paraburkholderia unamae]|nr:hypothetical protein PUN4_50032 [Paraburkholderia unamae]